MEEKDKLILALRTAYIAGIFSTIVCVVMLLNYWQLVTTDPIDSEVLKAMVNRLQEDSGNEALKVEIRNLDLMVRNAYFTSQWQIQSGAVLLVLGMLVTVAALRIYHTTKLKVVEPVANDPSIIVDLIISRKWLLYSVSAIFGFAILASFLSVDHLSETYALTEIQLEDDKLPVQEVIPIQNKEAEAPSTPISEDPATAPADSLAGESEADNLVSDEQAANTDEVPVANAIPSPPDISTINRNYPSFRGPMGLGVSYHKNIPTTWDGASGNNIVWKTKVPLHGYNSPILWGNSLFLTGADKNNQSLFCFDTKTGKQKWEAKVSGLSRPAGQIKPTEDTGYAAPTATTDGRYVFAIFATGDIICTDLNGKEIWKKNVGLPDNHYGHSSSLLVWKDQLLIQFDTNKAGTVLSLDVHTGKQVWQTARTSKISWASPILAKVGDHYELVLSSSPHVAAYDPQTGKELWAIECMYGEVGPSPAYQNGIVYAVNEYAKLVAIKPGKTPAILWESNEYLSEVASPVVAGDVLFVPTSYGVIACYNTKTGELLWEYEGDEGFYASPIV
ncbi:MAG: PQQ-like beta-propeller repeat protein, partial [Cyclobacteriaceae bacterium]|nr:PQQ-like beta-propeller repeat protein [Cyclobacteriaceae bacterium]